METIYLDTSDEITAVIDRIKHVKGIDIVLVVPQRSVLTQSIVNLKLLKKHIDMTGKDVVVVISEEVAANLASRVGLNVRSDVPRFSSDFEKAVKKDSSNKASQQSDVQPDDGGDYVVKNYQESEKIDNDLVEDASQELSVSDRDSVGVSLPRLDAVVDSDDLVEEVVSESVVDEAAFDVSQENEDELPARKNGAQSFVPRSGFKILSVFLLVCMVVAGLVLFVLLPRADVRIVPKIETETSQFDVAVVSSLSEPNFEQRRIPGSLIFSEKDTDVQSFQAVGEKDVSTKSKGTIVVYNSFSSSPQPLVAGTRFQAPNGGIYRSLRDVEIPGATIESGNALAGSLQLQVEAEAAGEEYDYEAGRLIIPGLSPEKQEDIYAEVVEPLSGGEEKVVRVVSEDDLEKAENQLLNQYMDEITAQLSEQVSPEQFFFDDAIKMEVIERNSSVEVDSEATDFQLSVKIRASTLVFAREYIAQIASAHSFDGKEGYEVVDQDIDDALTAELTNLDFEQEEMGVDVRIEHILYQSLDEQVLFDGIRGKDKDFAESFLSEQAAIESAEVTFWPFWVSSIPRFDRRTEFILDIESKLDSM